MEFLFFFFRSSLSLGILLLHFYEPALQSCKMEANTLRPSDFLALANTKINPRYVCSSSCATPWTCAALDIVPSQITCQEAGAAQMTPEVIVITDDELEASIRAVDYVVLSDSNPDDLIETLFVDCGSEDEAIQIEEMQTSWVDSRGSEDRIDSDATVDRIGDNVSTENTEKPDQCQDSSVGTCLEWKYGPVDSSIPKEHLAVFHMLQSVLSPQIIAEYKTSEKFIQDPSSLDPAPRARQVFPFRKDPKLVFKPSVPTTISVPSKHKQNGKNQFLVTLDFPEFKELAEVIVLSGPLKEYRLSVFSRIIPLRKLIDLPKYRADTRLTDNDIEVMGNSSVAIKRHDCRLTLAQVAIVLGLQDYKVSLMKYVEDAIFLMLDQLCGFQVGIQKWNRGTPLEQRKEMVIKVTRFLRIYFPMLTHDLVELVIKRGFYCRMQQYLRKKRQRRHRK